MKQILLGFLSVLMSLSVFAFPEWLQLTDAQNKECSAEKPCYVTQEKSKKRYEIIFDTNKEGKKLTLTAVQIGLVAQKKQIYKDLQNFQRYFEGEKFGLFAVDLNSDGYLDLALEASHGARLGAFFFYFVFNPKTGNFVQTPEQIEKLNIKEKGELVSAGSEQHFKVGEDFKIIKK